MGEKVKFWMRRIGFRADKIRAGWEGAFDHMA